MTELYPLKFKTIFKDKIWGGEKIRTILRKDFAPLKNCGETWEISGIKGNESVVAEGPLMDKSLPELIRTYKSDLLGKKIYEKSGDDFPLLVKFIDANEDLSIQVHPNDEIAQKQHQCLGKAEVWYIMQADEGATLISGFNQEMDEPTYLQHLKENSLKEILNKEKVKAGDVFYIPGGRVHTIGKGLLLAEIQQSSDITYRIYDFDRVDDSGNKRELHTEAALAAIDYQHYPSYKNTYDDVLNQPVELVQCEYFTTNMLHLDKPLARDYSEIDSFVILVCVQGSAELICNGRQIAIKTGDCYLIPAVIKQIEIKPLEELRLLECFV